MIPTSPDPLLTVQVLPLPDEVLVTATGEIDLSSVARFRAALREAAAFERPVRVDLTGLAYLDSSAVYALLDAWAAAGGAEDALRVRMRDGLLARLLGHAGLRQVTPSDEAEAL